jgi:aryl-alcohol dehydrogenase
MNITAAISYDDRPAPLLERVELDAPQPGELRVKIAATGICHSDLYFHGDFGSMFSPKPMVLGHEGAGIVEAVGVGVTGFEVGDHVVLSGSSCGHCANCHAGQTVYCTDMIKLCFAGMRADGTSPISQDGRRVAGAFFGQSSFATHVIATERTAVKVPRSAPLHLLGPLGCGMITGAGSVIGALGVRPGQSIAVFGAGGVGLAAVMAARIAGAARIVAIDIDESRLDLARSLGATDAVLSDDGTADALRSLLPSGFDFAFISAQPNPVFDTAVACLAVQGTAGFVIQPSADWSPNMLHMLTGGRKLQGIIGGNVNPKLFIPLLIDYWERGLFPFDRLITEFRFDQIGDAWEQYRTGKVIKPVLRMP